MFASASLIPELEDIIQHGSQDKRAKMLKTHRQSCSSTARRISTKTISGCSTTCSAAWWSRSRPRHAPRCPEGRWRRFNNAPTELMKKLAHDRGHRGGGPGARGISHGSRMTDLVNVMAQTQRPGSSRTPSAEPPPARRGDHRCVGASAASTDVVRNVAHQSNTRQASRRAGSPHWSGARKSDGDTGREVGQRHESAAGCSAELLVRAPRRRAGATVAAGGPDTQGGDPARARRRSEEVGAKIAPRDYTRAEHTVRELQQGPQAQRGRSWVSPTPSGSRKRSPRFRCSAACRSKPPTG